MTAPSSLNSPLAGLWPQTSGAPGQLAVVPASGVCWRSCWLAAVRGCCCTSALYLVLPGWRSGSRHAASGKPALLRDGSEVLIRPVQGADAPCLADGFARLSARSRQMRFLGPKNELSPAELRYFTEIDHHDHEALGAVDRANGRGLGVARYVRSAQDARSAEIAVTVVDEWQGRGLGTELVAQLSERAREEGIRRFTALVTADNVAVAGLARSVGAKLVRREPAAVVYEVPLAPPEEPGYPEAEQLKQSQSRIRVAGRRRRVAGAVATGRAEAVDLAERSGSAQRHGRTSGQRRPC
jgi:RimJ/RimL family protein N-acetyltransferase